MLTLSSVKFLMSMKDIPVQQPKIKRSLANAMFGIFQLYLCHGMSSSSNVRELTFLVVWVNVVHGKWISRYLAVVVSCRYNMLQWYGVNPNGGLRKSNDILQIQAIVTDEFLSKLVHGHIAALVLILDELGNILSYRQILAVGVLRALSLPTRLAKAAFSLSKALSNVSYSVPMPW